MPFDNLRRFYNWSFTSYTVLSIDTEDFKRNYKRSVPLKESGLSTVAGHYMNIKHCTRLVATDVY
jgi:hypothetical protein